MAEIWMNAEDNTLFFFISKLNLWITGLDCGEPFVFHDDEVNKDNLVKIGVL